MTRRQLLRWLAVVGAGCAAGGAKIPFGFAQVKKAYEEGETAYHSACTVNCGSSCFLRPIVANGRLCRIETDSSANTPHNLGNRACLRGRAMCQRVYTPDRIKYPMRCIKGTKRGDGKYERINWEEALDEIAEQWLRILKEYGPESVYRKYGSDTTSSGITNRNEWVRLANMLGGSLNEYGTYSTAQISQAAPLRRYPIPNLPDRVCLCGPHAMRSQTGVHLAESVIRRNSNASVSRNPLDCFYTFCPIGNWHNGCKSPYSPRLRRYRYRG